MGGSFSRLSGLRANEAVSVGRVCESREGFVLLQGRVSVIYLNSVHLSRKDNLV